MLRENANDTRDLDRTMLDYLMVLVSRNNGRLQMLLESQKDAVRGYGAIRDKTNFFLVTDEMIDTAAEIEAGQHVLRWINEQIAACLSLSTNLSVSYPNGKAEDE